MLWFPVGYTVGYVVLLVLVAAPLRRSGAYTLPDFAEARLESRRVRALASLLVIGIGWLYLLPQFQGAGLALSTVTGAPPALGSLIVAVVVLANVDGGRHAVDHPRPGHAVLAQAHRDLDPGVRPARAVVAERRGRPRTSPRTEPTGRRRSAASAAASTRSTRPTRRSLPSASARWGCRTCWSASTPTPTAARPAAPPSSWSACSALFYLFTPVYGVLGRVYLPTLPDGARADSVTLLLPAVDRSGPPRAPSCPRCSPAGRSPRSSRPPPV